MVGDANATDGGNGHKSIVSDTRVPSDPRQAVVAENSSSLQPAIDFDDDIENTKQRPSPQNPNGDDSERKLKREHERDLEKGLSKGEGEKGADDEDDAATANAHIESSSPEAASLDPNIVGWDGPNDPYVPNSALLSYNLFIYDFHIIHRHHLDRTPRIGHSEKSGEL